MRVSIITADGTTSYVEHIQPVEQEQFSTVLDDAKEAVNQVASGQKQTSGQTSTGNGTERSLEEIFEEAAATYQVDVDLLKAIAKQESNFRVDATSKSGAQGLMQLMPATAAGLGIEDAYDPYENVMGGAKLIRKLLDQYQGDVTLALAAYNAGGGNVAKYGGVPPFEETQNYVVKVQQYYQEGVKIPDMIVSEKTPSKEEIAKQLTTLLDELPQHRSYQTFLQQMEQLEAGDNKTKESQETDAYMAYRQLLGNANQAILKMISNMES